MVDGIGIDYVAYGTWHMAYRDKVPSNHGFWNSGLAFGLRTRLSDFHVYVVFGAPISLRILRT